MLELADALGAVFRPHTVNAAHGKLLRDNLVIQLVILGDKQRHRLGWQRYRLLRCGIRHGVTRAERQVNRNAEGRSLTRFALHVDFAVHQIDDFLDDGQSQTAAAHFIHARVHRTRELREHLLHVLGVHADAGVPHDRDQTNPVGVRQGFLVNLKLDFFRQPACTWPRWTADWCKSAAGASGQ